MLTKIRDAMRLLGVLVTAVVSRRPVRPRGDEATRSLIHIGDEGYVFGGHAVARLGRDVSVLSVSFANRSDSGASARLLEWLLAQEA